MVHQRIRHTGSMIGPYMSWNRNQNLRDHLFFQPVLGSEIGGGPAAMVISFPMAPVKMCHPVVTPTGSRPFASPFPFPSVARLILHVFRGPVGYGCSGSETIEADKTGGRVGWISRIAHSSIFSKARC